MRRLGKAILIAGALIVSVVALAALLLAIPATRPSVLGLAFRVIVWERGYHFASGVITFANHTLTITNLRIDDDRGEEFLAAKRLVVDIEPAGLIGRSDRLFGLHSVEVDQPLVALRRRSDGSWNFAGLLPHGGGAPNPAALPLRVHIAVIHGEIDVIDPQAVNEAGKSFALTGIESIVDFDKLAQSRGRLSALLQTKMGKAPLRATLFENDRISFARATLAGDAVPIAPIFDAFVPSPAFIIQGGIATIRMQAYAIGYGPGEAQQWHLGADARVRDGQVHVTPLIVPIQDLVCDLHFQDGLLSVGRARGFAAGIPLLAQGAVQLFGGTRLMIEAQQQGHLEQAKRLLAFTKPQDLEGQVFVAIRVEGPPSDIRVSGVVRLGNARYAIAHFPSVRGSFYYRQEHVTASALDVASEGAKFWSQADFDLSSAHVSTQGTVVAVAPAGTIPVVANVIQNGVAQGMASFTGPVAHLSGDGYAQVIGPARASIRTFFGGGPQSVSLGPLLYQVDGGDGFVWAQRTFGPPNAWSGVLIASHLPLHIHNGRTSFADIVGPPVALPSLDTTVEGEAFIVGPSRTAPQPDIGINMRATRVVYDGVDLGRAELLAAGNSSSVRIASATVSGPAATASARGEVVFEPNFALRSAVLAGDATANLSAVAPAFPSLHPRGITSGTFAAAYADHHWIGGAHVNSADASVASLPVRSSSAFVDTSLASTSVLADVIVPGGGIWAFGTLARLPGGGVPTGSVDAVVPSLDLAQLQSFGLRGAHGTASGFATMQGASNAPQVSAAATVRGSYNAIPYDGDLDVRYAAGTLRSNASRIALEGNQLTINGNVSGVRPGSSTSRAALALDVRVREGDLRALNRFTGSGAPITGSYSAEARIAGQLSQPKVNGHIDTDIGTIRGVAFNALHGSMRILPGEAHLSGGTVELGSSLFALDADEAARRFSVVAKSPHVDMSDFNDFFGGADIFAGTGSFDVRLASQGNGLSASGDALLDNAALRGYPLGHIQTAFSTSRRSGLHAVIDQKGPGGSMRLAGSVGFTRYRAGLPDFATARYHVRAHVRSLAVDEALPLFHQENLGLSGLLDADGTMRGTLHKPTGSASFALHDGYLRRIQIEEFSGKLSVDDAGMTLTAGTLKLPFLTALGSGSFGFAGQRIAGNASVQAPHLATLATTLRLPGSLHGHATGHVTVSGSLSRPRAVADVDATTGSFYDVAFDEAVLHAQYDPGDVSIGDTSITFAGKGGRLSVRGNLPVQLHPLALGPKDRRVDFAMSVEGMDLSVLDPVTKRFATLEGKLDAQATISGTAGDPVGKGTARISGASVHSPLQTVPVTDASADASFENDTITLQHLHGTVGSGSVDVQGAAHIVPAVGLRSYAGLQLWSRVSLHNTQVNVPNWISGNVNGQLSFTRSGPTPYVAGTVGISNATIPFSAIDALAQGGAVKAPETAQAPGVPPLRPGHTIVYGGGLWGPLSHTLTTIGRPTPAPTGFSLPSVDMNVGLNANNNVRIRGGSSIDLTTTGGIVIAGNLQSPSLSGQFQAIRGQVGYFDTTFRLISGTVTFDPTSGLLPTLNATAVTNVSGAQITLTVSGRVDNLNTDLESNPSMSRDEIIATLLHAPQVAALTSSNPSQAQATLVQTAQSYFNAQLTRSLLYPVESALASELNIESISLIFNQYGDLALELRTRFTPSVSAVYQSSFSVPVTTAYGVSYRLQDYLALDVLQTSRPDYALYTTVFNLRYTFR